jgi:hypothetical protein
MITGLVVLAGAVSACSAGGGSQAAPPAPPTAYDRVMSEVHPDGSVDTATALAAFSLAVSPLPGVPTPAGPQGMIPSGSVAVQWVLADWSKLTSAQQHAVTDALESGVTPAAFVTGAPAAPTTSPNLPCATADSPDAGPYRTALDAAISDIAGHLGRPLGLTIYLTVNNKQLEDGSNGKPSVMYTWACRGTKQAGSNNPTGCTIHINPWAFDGSFSDHDRQAFLTHEAMHCFLYDKFGASYDTVPAWLGEGIPIWVQTALTGGDTIATKYWNQYLQLDKTSLFGRTYDALGYYAQLADSGVNVWTRIDPMVAAFLSGGNAAAWQAAGASADFLNTWGAGYARGRQPGKDWDITGYGVPSTAPDAVHYDVLNSTTAQAAAPAEGVDLISLTLGSDVLSIAGDAGAQGLLGTSDGADHQLAGLIGADVCTRPGGCTCPAGTPGEGSKLSTMAGGAAYLGLSGGTKSVHTMLTGMNLDDFCAKKQQSCLVGKWTSVNFDIQAANGFLTEQGGAGVALTISADGSITVDFDPMQPVNFTSSQNAAGSVRYNGSGTGRIVLPPPNVTTGTFGAASGSFADLTVTVALTKPFAAVVLDHKSLGDMAGTASGLAGGLGSGVQSQPLFGSSGFTCTATTLVTTPPAGTAETGTWTLSRTGR